MTTSVIVSPRAFAFTLTACQSSSGTRTPCFGVLGLLGTRRTLAGGVATPGQRLVERDDRTALAVI